MKALTILVIIVIMACSPSKREQEILVDVTAPELIEMVSEAHPEKPVLVNFWVTWCAPCVEEFPYIMQLHEQYGDEFELVFVSGDFEEAKPEAREFLMEQGVDFTTYFKTGSDNEFISTFSDEWTGALPYTVIYDEQGTVVADWEGKADFERFKSELLKVINEG